MNTERPYRLLAPGPVPVPPAVLRAMGEKVLHHRTPQFSQILDRVWLLLKDVFNTKQPVQIITGTGSAAMEAAVVNTLSPGDEALVVVSGKFGERWADICEGHGIKTHRWNVEWGRGLDLDLFSEQLKSNRNVKVVFTQVCETSTATVHPISEMASVVHKVIPHALFAVDAITGVGCMPLPMDEWGIDVMVAGSQKAFMIPTGLSFIALSEKAWKVQAQSKAHKFYFDLAAERKCNEKGDSQFSIPTPLVVGLGIVLDQMHKVGLERLYRRCYALSEATRVCGDMLGLEVFSSSPSPSVTALATPSDSAKIRDWLEKERNITIMGGQDHLKGKILRIGHMGDVRNEDMVALFEALAEVLKKPSVKSELERQLKTAEPLFS
jgi:aspartate aminotransferase-like enzyme